MKATRGLVGSRGRGRMVSDYAMVSSHSRGHLCHSATHSTTRPIILHINSAFADSFATRAEIRGGQQSITHFGVDSASCGSSSA